MSEIKKNKIHNPQFITEPVPENISASDVGRLWVDKVNKKLIIGLADDGESGMLTDVMTGIDKTDISNTYFSGLSDVYVTIEAQVNGDTHYDHGYDFFADSAYTENTTQDIDDYYSFFYIEVADTETAGYLRTISTAEGDKHIRAAIGADNYVYNSQTKKVVNYSKIILPFTVKAVVELKFENKDVVDQGFELQDDNQTILIYGDPEGFFINKKVKVRYMV